MNSSRLWTLGSIIVIIALIAGTWFVGISPQLTEAAKANTERAGVEQLNARHVVTLKDLETQFKDIDKLRDELAELQLAVPEADETASLLRQVQSLADSAGVIVTDITLSSPEWFAAPAEVPADPELAAALGSVNPENFLVIPVEQTVAGTYAAVMNYVQALQTGQRAFLVHDVSLGSGLPSGGTQVEVTITGQIFVLLSGTAAAQAGGAESPTGGAEAPSDGEGVPQ